MEKTHMDKPKYDPDLIPLLKDEAHRLHEILKGESGASDEQKQWAMEELSGIHKALFNIETPKPIEIPQPAIVPEDSLTWVKANKKTTWFSK
jgi:hypothetical protein